MLQRIDRTAVCSLLSLRMSLPPTHCASRGLKSSQFTPPTRQDKTVWTSHSFPCRASTSGDSRFGVIRQPSVDFCVMRLTSWTAAGIWIEWAFSNFSSLQYEQLYPFASPCVWSAYSLLTQWISATVAINNFTETLSEDISIPSENSFNASDTILLFNKVLSSAAASLERAFREF